MSCRLITDHNYCDVPRECGVLPRYLQYGSAEAEAQKLFPVSDQPDKLVPQDEWKERILEAHAKRMFPMHYFEAANVPAKNQDGTNYCWSYSLASTVEAVNLMQGQPYRRLAPATLGHLVNWKNQGYWLSEALTGARKFGFASSEFAPDGVTNDRLFKPGWEGDALENRPLEWFDTIGVDNRRQDEFEQVRQCVSLLLTPSPLEAALYWWGHALMVAGLIWDETALYNLRWIYWNSHNDGRIELTGQRGIPDEAYAPRSVTFSPN